MRTGIADSIKCEKKHEKNQKFRRKKNFWFLCVWEMDRLQLEFYMEHFADDMQAGQFGSRKNHRCIGGIFCLQDQQAIFFQNTLEGGSFVVDDDNAGLELLKTFRKAQDYLVRLNWQDEVIFPQEAASKNIRQLEKASRALSEGNITDALKALYRVDNNMYAFLFDEEVYYHFTEYILHQPKDRLMWGAGRIMHHENLYGIVQKLKQRMEEETPELDSEIRRLEAALRRQKAYYKDDIRYLNTSVNKLSAMLDNIYNNLLSF